MQKLFDDILSIDGVKGAMVFSFKGDLIFKKFTNAVHRDPKDFDWNRFVELLEGMRETELIFEKGRLYIRRSDVGYLVIVMGLFVPMAILRLHCDILLPSLVPDKSSKRWSRFFKRQ
jgi:hypothetical protein